MAIQNLGDLKTAVGTWLNRADLTSYIPDFIRLGEQRIFYGGDDPHLTEPLRIPAMMARDTGAISSGAISFPTRFLESIRIGANSGLGYWPLDYLSPQRFSEYINSDAQPTVYTIMNNQIETAGTGAADYIHDYYQAFSTLTADADTNWVLTNAPGIYLYAALIESSPFLVDMTMFNGWLAMYKSQVASVNHTTKRYAGGSLAARVVK